MNALRKLVPDLLWSWDLRLLQDHPRLWATRFHLHAWFLLLLNAAAVAVGLLIRVDHHRFPNPEGLFAYMLVPAAAYAAFWVYRAARFNAEKRFGRHSAISDAAELLILWASLLLILSLPFTLAFTVAQRAAHLTPDAQSTAEVDLLNEQAPWFYGHDEYWEEPELAEVHAAEAAAAGGSRTKAPQGAGSHRFFRSLQEYRLRHDAAERARTSEVPELHDIYEGYLSRAAYAMDSTDRNGYAPDTARLYLAKADSIERSRPLLYIHHGWYTPAGSTLPYLADSLLEQRYLQRVAAGAPMDTAAVTKALAIARKYHGGVRLIGAEGVQREFDRRVRSSAQLRLARLQLERIARAKEMRYFFWDEEGFFHAIALLSLALALLLTAFKSLYWQPFLIAVITGALTPVLLLVFALIVERDVLPWSDDDIMAYGHWLLMAAMIAQLATVRRLRAYSTRRAVMTVLASAVLPFFALFTLLLLHEGFDVFGSDRLSAAISEIALSDPDDPRLPALNAALTALQQRIHRTMMAALWGGVALYALVLHPVLKGLYAHLMALPERR